MRRVGVIIVLSAMALGCRPGSEPAPAAIPEPPTSSSSVRASAPSTTIAPQPTTTRAPPQPRIEHRLCGLTGGKVSDDGGSCDCGPGSRFLLKGGCVKEPELRRRCTSTGGGFRPGDLRCDCPPWHRTENTAEETGFCARTYGAAPTQEHQRACARSGGKWLVDPFGPSSTFCECPRFTDVFLPAGGGCVLVTIGESRCSSTGGRWTDDSADKYYCVCPAGADADDAGRCPPGLVARGAATW